MAKYRVDVKAFMSVGVEADSPRQARELADAYVESHSPGHGYIDGYNTTLTEGRILDDYGFSVDGRSDVDEDEDDHHAG
jgi:hypothetical protein